MDNVSFFLRLGYFPRRKSRLCQRLLLKTRNCSNHRCSTDTTVVENKLLRAALRTTPGVFMRGKHLGNNGKNKPPSRYFSRIVHLFRDTSFPSLKRLPLLQQLPLQLQRQPLALFFHKRNSLGPQPLQNPRQLYLDGRWHIPF